MALVLLDRPSRAPDLCSVAVDAVRGGELAIQHLLDQGHERSACVNGPLPIRQCADRLEDVQRAIRAAGADPSQMLLTVTTPFLSACEGELPVEIILRARERPGAILCANDLLALRVMRGLSRRGFAIPRDFALVGYDDVDFAGMLSAPLTSVRQPNDQPGCSAAELLLDEAGNAGAHEHRQITYQLELIIRESSSDRWRTSSVR
jgi:LacI family transcriptional regulator